jgi:phosphatidylserine/phosphatidylglycerophosphate/cardiolipin synthase-like enzyme
MPMIALSNTAELVAALRDAHAVSFTAYTLRPGRVLDALDRAARNGTRVTVRLEGSIYKDGGDVAEANEASIERLRAAGADAALTARAQGTTGPMLHGKMAVVDGTLFLDDRNFPSDGEDTIVRDDFACDVAMARDAAEEREDPPTRFFSVTKRASLAAEARLIAEAQPGDSVVVETESFGGYNRVFDAIDAACARGAHVRLLVNDRCLLGNESEAAAIARLRADGAEIRTCGGDEKFAIVRGTRGWIGSANATAAFDHPDTIDWGMRTDAPDIVVHDCAAFESRWTCCRPAATRAAFDETR